MGKKSSKHYFANMDALIGSNPILSPMQVWQDLNILNKLNFVKWTGTPAASGADKATVTVPDDNLYVVLAVTMNVALSGTFNDYGGSSTPYSGTYELPLWNSWFNGPDLTNPSNVRRAPYSCFWDPSATVFFTSGDDMFISGDAGVIDVSQAYQANPSATFNVYYAQLRNLGVPIHRVRLEWESQLGNDADVYSPQPTQQITYPYYAGVGSTGVDMGPSALLPDFRIEVAASYGVNAPDGDADFCDIVEDIFKSGTLALETQLGEIHRGLNCGELPGMVQQNAIQVAAASSPRLPFYRPNKANAVLLAFGLSDQAGSGAPAISDAAPNTWTPIATGDQYGIWYVPAAAAKTGNVVTFSPSGGNKTHASFFIAEMDPDSNVVAAPVVASGTGTLAKVTIQTSGPAWILVIAMIPAASDFSSDTPPVNWDWAFGAYGAMDNRIRVAKRYVAAAGTYTFATPIANSDAWVAAAIAVSAQDPVSYPKPLGNILDDGTMELVRAQCKANGLWGSLSMQSQQPASSWLKDLYQAMNAWPVWSGFKLKSVPMSEVSAVGNGAVYTAPTAAGPVADLAEDDMIGDASSPLVTVSRAAQPDIQSILQMQFTSRAADYVDVTVSEPETSGIALFGPKKDSPQVMSCVYDATIARMLLGIAVRRRAMARNGYKFKLKAKWQLLEPGDLVTITESKINLQALPVRLTSIEEDEDRALDCQAEPFVYGMNAPAPLPITSTVVNTIDLQADAGDVNAPVFVEPVLELTSGIQNELWIVVSSPSANYGGCAAFMSTDGGLSYNQIGTINGSGITGVSTADWPLGTDPDTAHDLPLDLTESLGVLASYQTSDEDNFVYPCYMAGGSGPIPYELMTYAVATLTAANKYTLEATGAGNKLRRGVFGTPIVDHPLGTRFAFLSGTSGILQFNFAPKLVGVTLHFKFCSFNQFGNALQDISTVTDYTYTPTGLPSQQNLVLVNGG